MKKRLIIILSGLAVAGAISFSLPQVFAQQTNPAGIPPAPGTPGIPASTPAPSALPGQTPPLQPRRLPQRPPMARHFQIRNAIRALQMAKQDLKASPTDFEGHRDSAIEACEKAEAELSEIMKHVAETNTPVATPPPAGPGTTPPPVAK